MLKRHLTARELHSLSLRSLPLEREIESFQHWRNCSPCRNHLKTEQVRCGFKQLPHRDNQKVFVVSVTHPQALDIYQTATGVLALNLKPAETPDFAGQLATQGYKLESRPPADKPEALLAEIQSFFKSGKPFILPQLDTRLIPTEFSLKVLFWTWLIPFGQRVSYGEIARWIGSPKAARSVGGALHRNPLPLVIPCHRVLGADGRLTGFGGGLDLKEELLCLEQDYLSGR